MPACPPADVTLASRPPAHAALRLSFRARQTSVAKAGVRAEKVFPREERNLFIFPTICPYVGQPTHGMLIICSTHDPLILSVELVPETGLLGFLLARDMLPNLL